ncbi:hypothetical protein B0A49_09297 [Cryomyces minteri]|uniref:Transcription factor IIIC putative zinc-finger domain-containing protein n=1 Tax=Cryomyces minteri TaxID=331657 RepID=A0A4U0WLR8_9PEZI|nr:hypothetical protein B0A49_09297 [Cryomyces minteri]
MVEYTISANHQSTLTISRSDKRRGRPSLVKRGRPLAPDDLSADAILLDIKQWMNTDGHAPQGTQRLEEEVRDWILEVMRMPYASPDSNLEASPTGKAGLRPRFHASDPNAIVRHLKQNVVHDPEIISSRYSRLLSLVKDAAPSPKPLDLDIAAKLTDVVTGLSSEVLASLCKSDKRSGIILRVYSMIRATTRQTIDGETIQDSELDVEKEDGDPEHFRCALTFLAIQAPGVSKFCGLCGIQYLNDSILQENVEITPATLPQPSNGVDKDDQTLKDALNAEGSGVERTVSEGKQGANKIATLARILFATCDVCVYCGGKYVG